MIDLNCDMGESLPNDADIMPYITSANIACGYHAGNEDVMRRTIELALEHNVFIGAHPGFSDRQNFGRNELHLSEGEYYSLITDQLILCKKIADEFEAPIHHVKPHGALYNMAARDKSLAATIAQAVKDFDENLVLYGLSGSYLITESKALGLLTFNEVFADRTYQDDGSLTPRSNPKALIKDEELAVSQVKKMVEQKTVSSINNKTIAITAETICIHGDGEKAVRFAARIAAALQLKQDNARGNSPKQ